MSLEKEKDQRIFCAISQSTATNKWKLVWLKNGEIGGNKSSIFLHSLFLLIDTKNWIFNKDKIISFVFIVSINALIISKLS